MAAVAVPGLGLVLGLWTGGPVATACCVVLGEGMILAVASYLTWSSRKSRLLFPNGILLGMAIAAVLHGLYFVAADPRHAGREWAMLAGFGLASALLMGIPLGTTLGIGFVLLRRLGGRAASDGP